LALAGDAAAGELIFAEICVKIVQRCV